MTERAWVILFSLLCVLSGVLALVSWHGGEIRLAFEFAVSAVCSFCALVAMIHQVMKEGR